MAYVRRHLEAYRIWRHFSFNPPGSIAMQNGGHRRYLGFGRAQFRALCDCCGLVGPQGGVGGQGPVCWPDRAAADIFLARVLRTEETGAGAAAFSALDFPRFLREVAVPLGESLAVGGSGGGGEVEA